jgi:hypothetical protein
MLMPIFNLDPEQISSPATSKHRREEDDMYMYGM